MKHFHAMIISCLLTHVAGAATFEVVGGSNQISAGWSTELEIVTTPRWGVNGTCQTKNYLSPYAWTDIAAPPSIVDMECEGSYPRSGIQNVVAGAWNTAGGNPRAFVGDVVSSVELPPFPGASPDNSRAYGLWRDNMTEQMQVVGSAIRADGRRVAFRWDESNPGVLIDMGCPNGDDGCTQFTGSAAFGVYPRTLPHLQPQMVGSATMGPEGSGFVWATYYNTSMKLLPQPSPGDSLMGAVGMNYESTAIVGYAGVGPPETPTKMDPAIWMGGGTSWRAHALRDPDPLWCPSNHVYSNDGGYAINTAYQGKVIWGGAHCGKAFVSFTHNQAYVSPPIDVKAILERQGADLTGVEELDTVTGINTPDFYDGDFNVTGTGHYTNGDKFAYKATFDVVPEPGTSLSLISGGALLLFLKRRKVSRAVLPPFAPQPTTTRRAGP